MSWLGREGGYGYFIPKGAGKFLEVRGKRMWIKARSEDTQGRLAMWEQIHPPAYTASPHIHSDAVEAMYVLDGDYSYSVGGESFQAATGSFVLIPAGVPHGFESGEGGGTMLVMFTPGGYDRYWEEMSEAERSGPVSAEDQVSLARKHATFPA